MIHFGEVNKFDSITERNIDSPLSQEKSDVTTESAQSFWNAMFTEAKEEDESDIIDEMLAAIFNRSSEEFDFNDHLSDEMKGILSQFEESNWADISLDEKNSLIEKYKNLVAESLEIENVPELIWIDEADGAYGYYDASTNTICLNKSNLIDDPKELVNTIPHELRHAYQHMRSEKSETIMDALYKLNFANYIEPIQLADGRYLFFTDYQDQLVEAEARAYANIYSEGMV